MIIKAVCNEVKHCSGFESYCIRRDLNLWDLGHADAAVGYGSEVVKMHLALFGDLSLAAEASIGHQWGPLVVIGDQLYRSVSYTSMALWP